MRAVVRAHDSPAAPGARPAVLADLVMSGWKLGSIGLLAVGASGLVVAAMNVLFGRSFVAAVAPGIKLPAAVLPVLAQHLAQRAQLRPGVHAGEQ